MMATTEKPNVFDLFDAGQDALKHGDFIRAAALFTSAAQCALTDGGRAVLEEKARFASNMAEQQERRRQLP